jgi:hypothetical protein
MTADFPAARSAPGLGAISGRFWLDFGKNPPRFSVFSGSRRLAVLFYQLALRKLGNSRPGVDFIRVKVKHPPPPMSLNTLGFIPLFPCFRRPAVATLRKAATNGKPS